MNGYLVQIGDAKAFLIYLRESPHVGDVIQGTKHGALRISQRVWLPSGELVIRVTAE